MKKSELLRATPWTREKLNQFVEGKVEESLYSDYKAADSLSKSEGKKTEISKDVSALANSDGGTIILLYMELQNTKAKLHSYLIK